MRMMIVCEIRSSSPNSISPSKTSPPCSASPSPSSANRNAAPANPAVRRRRCWRWQGCIWRRFGRCWRSGNEKLSVEIRRVVSFLLHHRKVTHSSVFLRIRLTFRYFGVVSCCADQWSNPVFLSPRFRGWTATYSFECRFAHASSVHGRSD